MMLKKGVWYRCGWDPEHMIVYFDDDFVDYIVTRFDERKIGGEVSVFDLFSLVLKSVFKRVFTRGGSV